MTSQPAYKEKISHLQLRLSVVVGLAAVFIVGLGVVLFQQNKKRLSLPVAPASTQLKQNEFNGLWKSLQQKTVPVESTGEIQYGGDVGKVEPFD